MKKIMLMVMVLLILVFAGCKEQNNTVVAPTQPAQTSDTSDAGDTTTTNDSTTTADDSDSMVSGPDKTNIDLTLMDVYFNPSFPTVGDDVELRMKVKNQGTEDANSFSYKIKIFKNGNLWKEETLTNNEPLNRGMDLKLTSTYTLTSTGTYSAEVYIDPNNKIGELIETNNYMKSKADATVSVSSAK